MRRHVTAGLRSKWLQRLICVAGGQRRSCLDSVPQWPQTSKFPPAHYTMGKTWDMTGSTSGVVNEPQSDSLPLLPLLPLLLRRLRFSFLCLLRFSFFAFFSFLGFFSFFSFFAFFCSFFHLRGKRGGRWSNAR